MKKRLALPLSLLALLSCTACAAKAPEATVPETEASVPAAQTALAAAAATDGDALWALVNRAYLYAFPLVITDVTKTSSTNTESPTDERAPINQLSHSLHLIDASFHTVVSPNVDTLYSQAWLDIREEPVIFILPETDRFCNVQLLDAWTNTAAVLDQAGAYAITLPGWDGELPDGVTRVDVPTATVWAIVRTVLSGSADLPNVYAIQAGMQMFPLSAYGQAEYTAPKGTHSQENEFVPVNKVLSMTPAEFFNTANTLMQQNPPAKADDELLAQLTAINVGPGMRFDMSVLGADAAERWTEMLQQLRGVLAADSMNYTTQLGQWFYYDRPIGDFGTEYTYRAMVALVGLGANTVDVAVYPRTNTDVTGAALTGEKTYTLHFDTFPPTLEGGFWSVTAYSEDDFLIDNPIDRYCINDRSDFRLNEDGSLDITLSKDAPEDLSNWLPVGDGQFHLFMRIYVPDMTALRTWQAPVICEQ